MYIRSDSSPSTVLWAFHTIQPSSFALWFLLSIFFFSFLAYLSRRRLDVCQLLAHTWCGLDAQNAGLKCAAHASLKIQDAKNCYLRTIALLCWAISSQLGHVSAIGKKLVKHQYLPTQVLMHKMVNFGPLASGIHSGVWGTPANFNGFRVLAALLHGTLVLGVSVEHRAQHSAGRPSSWTLAHILVCISVRIFSFLDLGPS